MFAQKSSEKVKVLLKNSLCWGVPVGPREEPAAGWCRAGAVVLSTLLCRWVRGLKFSDIYCGGWKVPVWRVLFYEGLENCGRISSAIRAAAYRFRESKPHRLKERWGRLQSECVSRCWCVSGVC
ncbi:hypothetical protein [Kamptonema formosum]|uniref:hypothetical protein n=1 Tax=Kamptonema formosum TaxID=331992 RepID=UPI00034670C7|nr:hypothetical protein [Oscillatoria sp. PCC 10802]